MVRHGMTMCIIVCHVIFPMWMAILTHPLSQPHFGAKCENATHTPKSGRLGVLRDSQKFRRRFEGSNLLALVRSLYQWKFLENCQFDSRPLKVRNRPLLDVASRIATWRWKALDKNYNFGSNLVPIRVRGEELWASKVPGLQPGIASGLQLGSPGKKSHSDVTSTVRRREYYMGEGGGLPSPGRGESCVWKCLWLVETPKGVPEC
jgi:hypothetical protein